ncbi:Sterol regulatory element-binding protein cleavage-activating protein [Trichinella britovi]|uniref:Sterol regulatory element-binding protein cleavage-activating protein n=1 Tax=Trichinella britovi TaxID=45882 RepID=A0A0V1D636_TRIBR|nr:Sterol regulatory element-binding protein cleavage-activating protein [Trichinella sp. T9]KRY56985.1 Sterol regulatory element-binding protein cleavage-activating protein [Trichinella britovi]
MNNRSQKNCEETMNYYHLKYQSVIVTSFSGKQQSVDSVCYQFHERSGVEMQRKGVIVRRRWQILERRVTHAYYKYGRFCSSHPFATLITSLSMALLLSYPLSRVRWFYPSPCVLVKTHGWPASPQPDELTWLYQKYPVAQILQIVVRLYDDSNGADMTDVVRGFYSMAFELDDQIKALLPNSSKEEETCHEQSPAGLLVLSPTGIWCHNRRLFFMDRHFLEKIKTTRSCKFDLLYGVPNSIRLSSYALTIIADQNTTDFLIQLRNQFSAPDAGESAADLIHVQYKIKKTWMDYMLLFVSYIILLLYLYVCAQKIEMVKSKWALAFGAGCTVAFSLLMAAGICSHFSLIRRTWLVELFPYLALIVGVENTLCITRSVVSTPVHLEVNIRLARGLASEGWSITKNFLIGFCVLAVGFCSDVPEISEFCTVALVGFVVDFYMQLFFYVPCLTFDLARFGPNDKLRLSRAQFGERDTIQNYPDDHYPSLKASLLQEILPYIQSNYDEYYSLNDCLTDADTNVNINADANSRVDFLHRIPIPHCLEQLLRRNRPRYFQRFFMLAISVWIVWFAVGIHRCFNPSESLPTKLPEEKPHWELFHCWAELLESKGVTVSRRFVTILPAVELQARVNRSLVKTVRRQARDAQPLIVENVKHGNILAAGEPQFGNRISWLEVKLTAILILTCAIFLTVAIFIIYVCFGVRAENGKRPPALWKIPTRQTTDSSCFVESLPKAFQKQHVDYKAVLAMNDRVVSVSVDNHVTIWNSRTGQIEHPLNRPLLRVKPIDKIQPPWDNFMKSADIWCICGQNSLLALGYSNGVCSLYDINRTGCILSQVAPSKVGITAIVLQGNRLILALLDGKLHFMELKTISSLNIHGIQCTEIKAVQLHKMTITCVTVCNSLLLTASMDQTLKVCDLNTGCVEFSMHRHNSPVISVAVDRLTDTFVYSCCMDGVICAWNLCKLGRLVWIQRDCVGCSAEIALALTGRFLVGYSLSEIIWIWDKYDGLLISQIKQSLEKFIPFCLDTPQIVVLDDGLIAVNQKQSIQLWDLEKKMMLRQVDLDNQMDGIHDLQRLGEHALLCFISDVIYRVDFPIIKSFITIQSSSTPAVVLNVDTLGNRSLSEWSADKCPWS